MAIRAASALSRVRGWPGHRTRGLGVLTSPSHGEDRQFKSGRVHFSIFDVVIESGVRDRYATSFIEFILIFPIIVLVATPTEEHDG